MTRTPLPPDIPHQIEVAYTPRGEQAVVRFELPPPDVIPAVASYTYVGTTGEMREKKRADVLVAPPTGRAQTWSPPPAGRDNASS